MQGLEIEQRTPNRVAHRRADLIRKRMVKRMEIAEKLDAKRIKVRILAEAGTYIKELITGDKGKTVPSFSSMLECNAKCKSLVVTRIYDGFLDLLF